MSLGLEDTNNGNEVSQALYNEKESVVEEISVVEENGIAENKVTAEKPADLSQSVAPPIPEVAAPVQEDAPKKSFASVVSNFPGFLEIGSTVYNIFIFSNIVLGSGVCIEQEHGSISCEGCPA